MTLLARAALAVTLSYTLSAAASACSTCGCNLTSDWLSQGLVAESNTTLSLRYDYVPQTQLRSGLQSVDRTKITFPNATEIERYTDNSYLTAALDRPLGSKWAVNLQVPFVMRPHATVGSGDTETSYSSTTGIGDVRLSARYQRAVAAGIWGVQAGVKLPTGGVHQNFTAGPSAGQIADPSLQPGSGTTNALVGAYHFGRLGPKFDYALQVQGDIPLNERLSYRPGTAATLSASVRFLRWPRVVPQLQLNARVAARDSGANADTVNTGGEHIYAAPGVTFNLTRRASAFTIVQAPLYERVNGLQLTPKATFSAGLTYRL